MIEERTEPMVTHQTLAAWRAGLAKIRGNERQRAVPLSVETGRLLETVGQALAQGGAALSTNDIAQIEALTSVDASYS